MHLVDSVFGTQLLEKGKRSDSMYIVLIGQLASRERFAELAFLYSLVLVILMELVDSDD